MARQKLILAVDDEPVNLFVLMTMLEGMGYDCVAAKDGLEAVAQADTARPGLILMDLSMPRLDGIEAAKRIREAHPEERIPIVAVTANVTSRQRDDCAAAGFDGFIGKPLELTELRKTVERFAGETA